MKYSKEMAEKLNELLQKNTDSEKGFKKAAEDVDNPELKSLFTDIARQRYDFRHELKSEIRNFGEAPEKGSSMKADLHHSWMDLKSSVSGDGDKAVLEEAARGEKTAIDEYRSVLDNNNFPPSTANMLIKQRNSFKETLEKIHAVER